MKIGELLGSGRSADVYAIGDGLVLRRYRFDIDAGREAAVMVYVAAHGYPVPEVRPPGDGPRTDLVMARVDGPTMLRALLDGKITPEEVGEVLARLLRELHEIPAKESGDPGDRVLHLDLHPDNVVLTADGPVVIDWCNTREGPPALDCALSAVILAQVAVDPGVEFADGARRVLAAMAAALGDALDVDEPLESAKARRAADRAMSAAEVALLDDAVALIRSLP